MRFADLFGSVSSNSTSGPNGYECPMKEDYTSDLMETIDLSSVSPYDFIPLDYFTVQQSLVKMYHSVLESTNKRNVGAGILAAAFLYGSWKACRVWTNRTDSTSEGMYSPSRKIRRRDGFSRQDYGDSAASKTFTVSSAERSVETKDHVLSSHPPKDKPVGSEELAAISENFHRQLKDAMSKVDDFKFRLKDLESNKLLLTSEIDARKKMIEKLQDEISCERERRQQAELKVEMMSMEYSQIRQLRKEVTVKTAHVNRLEKLMAEKDDLQMKLFSDNVVLPRSVVEARAKEFGELQNRVHQLQAEIDSTRRFRDFEVGCQPCRYASSVWLEDHSLSLPASHLSEIQVSSNKSFQTETSVALPESMIKKLPNTKLTIADRSPVLTRPMAESVEKMSSTSASVALSNKTPTGMKYMKDQTDYQTMLAGSPTSNKTDDLSGSSSVLQKDTNLFAQIQTLIGDFRNSNLDRSHDNLALFTDLGTLLGSNRPRMNYKQIGENTSDEKSNSLMSAVSASDDSDTDNTRVHSVCIRKSLSKRGTTLKRLSRYRRDKRKDNVHLKRKLAVQYFDGQTRLIGLKDSSAFPAVSRDLTHAILGKAENSAQNSVGSVGDQLASTKSPAFKSCGEHHTRSGDSWILIIPKDTQRE